MPTLTEVHTEFSHRLGHLGNVVVAGGAVRDTLMGKHPKDWDVFVLQGPQWDFSKAKAAMPAIVGDLKAVEPAVEWHNSEPFLAAGVRWAGDEVQVLVNPAPDMKTLIQTFDWNVCLFGYDGREFHKGEQIENIAVGKSLRLQTTTFPLSTLRRGFRFSERFVMKLEKADVVSLCNKIIENAKKNNDVGPHGNVPDAPSLEKNVLVRA